MPRHGQESGSLAEKSLHLTNAPRVNHNAKYHQLVLYSATVND